MLESLRLAARHSNLGNPMDLVVLVFLQPHGSANAANGSDSALANIVVVLVNHQYTDLFINNGQSWCWIQISKYTLSREY